MWPRDRGVEDVVRIGRLAVELWTLVGESSTLVASHVLGPDHSVTELAQAIRGLHGRVKHRAVTIAFESAWMPVVFVDAGDEILLPAQMEQFIRHRLSLYGPDSFGLRSSWDVRSEHRVGSRQSMGYGLPLLVKAAVVDATRAADIRMRLMTSAFSWAWARQGKGARKGASAWFALCEQDRTLIGRVHSGRISDLNTGASPASNGQEVKVLVEIEAMRTGADAIHPITIVDWPNAASIQKATAGAPPYPANREVSAASGAA